MIGEMEVSFCIYICDKIKDQRNSLATASGFPGFTLHSIA